MRKAPVYDLSTRCTAYGYTIPQKEHLHTGWETTRCPKCGVNFIPVPKGKGESARRSSPDITMGTW
jgi:hypothetical protein